MDLKPQWQFQFKSNILQPERNASAYLMGCSDWSQSSIKDLRPPDEMIESRLFENFTALKTDERGNYFQIIWTSLVKSGWPIDNARNQRHSCCQWWQGSGDAWLKVKPVAANEHRLSENKGLADWPIMFSALKTFSPELPLFDPKRIIDFREQ